MAKATKTSTDYKVVLELSGKEAEALRAVFQEVGGDPVLSRRGLIDAVDSALKVAGVAEFTTDLTTGRSLSFYNSK